jgi:tyrosine-specific transport protein
VGAGILAIPAVTQESGFLASAVACIGCWVFMVTISLYDTMLNDHLFQKLKLIGICKFNHLINTLNTSPHVWAQTLFLIGEAQHMEYLIEIEVND